MTVFASTIRSNGQEHAVVLVHRNWGEDALYFRGEDGRLWSINRALTDRRDPDPFVTFSCGRAACRTADLVEMAGLVAELGRDLDRNDVAPFSELSPDDLWREPPEEPEAEVARGA